jgi:hypothetical protein
MQEVVVRYVAYFAIAVYSTLVTQCKAGVIFGCAVDISRSEARTISISIVAPELGLLGSAFRYYC